MIIMIFIAVIFILSLIYCIYYRTKEGWMILILVTVWFLYFLFVALGFTSETTEWNTRYLGLSSRIALWNSGAEDPTLWTDVAEYNEDLADAKKNTKNIWVNWISEKDCLNYEPIEIPEYERKG